jgi:hypothetical protein
MNNLIINIIILIILIIILIIYYCKNIEIFDDYNIKSEPINSDTSIKLTQPSIIKINNGSDITITAGNYNISFAYGAISISGLTTDYSYPIIKNTNGIIINPSLWYKFDNNILDSSGNNNDLILKGGVYNFSYTVYAKGGCSIISNDTSLSLVSTNTYTIDNANHNMSVSFWYNIFGLMRIFDVFCYGNTGYFYIQRYSTTNKITMKFANVSLTTTNDYYNADNKWHHFAMSGEKIGTAVRLKIYIDGALVQDNGSFGAGTWVGYTEKFHVFNGLAPKAHMDDLRVYVGTTLTDFQVTELYKGRVEIYRLRSINQDAENEVNKKATSELIKYPTSFPTIINDVIGSSINNYSQTFLINGLLYTIKFSSYDENYKKNTPLNLFDSNNNNIKNIGGSFSNNKTNRYNSDTGEYLDASIGNFTDNGVNERGEWVSIQFPMQITLKYYGFVCINGSENLAPGKWKVYAKQNNSYILIDDYTTSRLSNIDYKNNYLFKKAINPENQINSNTYVFIFKALASSDINNYLNYKLNFNEILLLGE